MKKNKPVFEGKMFLKKGDEVIVLAGKDKGKRGKVIQTIPKQGKVIVDGVNVVTKHQKPRTANTRAMVKQQLGEMHLPLGVSQAKVMLVCPKCNKETRPLHVVGVEDRSARKCRKCGEIIDG
jgi:large subunit ribosomal protein L24